jgi:hypothetical protein
MEFPGSDQRGNRTRLCGHESGDDRAALSDLDFLAPLDADEHASGVLVDFAHGYLGHGLIGET